MGGCTCHHPMDVGSIPQDDIICEMENFEGADVGSEKAGFGTNAPPA